VGIQLLICTRCQGSKTTTTKAQRLVLLEKGGVAVAVEYILQIEVEQLAASPTIYVLDCGQRKDPAQAVGLLIEWRKVHS